jgi:hypothetical protein
MHEPPYYVRTCVCCLHRARVALAGLCRCVVLALMHICMHECVRACSGGGEVYLPRGQYWLSGPIVVPPGVRLVGEAMQLVSIYFQEASKAQAPKPSYVFSGWQSPPQPAPSIPFLGTNATGTLQTDPSVSTCGGSGCCITSGLKVMACGAEHAREEGVLMSTDTTGLVTLRFNNCTGKSCCLANINGHFNPTCSQATAWKIQKGYTGNQTVLQTADDRGCLTVQAKRGTKITPGMGLEIDQCWHINQTQNFLVPGVFFSPPPPPPPPPPPHPAPSTTAWGVEGLTIYISHWCKFE